MGRVRVGAARAASARMGVSYGLGSMRMIGVVAMVAIVAIAVIAKVVLAAPAGSARGLRAPRAIVSMDPLVHKHRLMRSAGMQMHAGAGGVGDSSSGFSSRCKVYNFTQPVDHFGYLRNVTFQQRYLVYDDNWRRASDARGPGPIFFYTGNEGPIELFTDNTGFMWDLADNVYGDDFAPMLVFAEHRYYGNSNPFGSAANAYNTSENLQYLTSEQALADFARLIEYIKTDPSRNCSSSPVITFGGSYGGMLSSWFRLKYPNMVQGAIASSAPIWQLTDITPPERYMQIITTDFYNAKDGGLCSQAVYNSWDALTRLANTSMATVKKYFPACYPEYSFNTTDEMQTLVFPWLSAGYQYLAMADYPYATSFLGPLPPNPINYVCANAPAASASDELLIAFVASIGQAYWNAGVNQTCFAFNATQPSTLGLYDGWNYQSCTEVIQPIGQYYTGWMPGQDMFYYAPWDLEEQVQSCAQQYGVESRPHWAAVFYGGDKAPNLLTGSRIVFTNGDLDPWSGGGVTVSLSSSVVSFVMTDSAHHLDLRSQNKDDPTDVTYTRLQIRRYISAWIRGFDDPSQESVSLPTKWVVMISVSGTLGIVFFGAFLFFYCRRRKARAGAVTSSGVSGYRSMA